MEILFNSLIEDFVDYALEIGLQVTCYLQTCYEVHMHDVIVIELSFIATHPEILYRLFQNVMHKYFKSGCSS